MLVGIEATAHAEAPVPLPPVVVPLPPADEPDSPARRDPAGSITVVETQEHRGEAKEAAELLAPAPGVIIHDQGGFGQTKTLLVRGASPNGVLVFLDGIPLNGAGGMVDLSRIPSAIIDRLEVLRGGAGARYGSGGLGGAVNIVTRPLRTGASFTAEATQGSFGTTLAQVAGSAEVGGGQGLLLLHGAHSDGDFTYLFNDKPQLPGNPLAERTRENNQAMLGGALLKYRRELPAGFTIDGMAEAALESRGLAGTVDNPTLDAKQSSQRLSTGFRATRRTQSGTELSTRAFLRRDHLRLEGGYFGAGIEQVELALGAEVAGSMLIRGMHNVSGSVQLEGESLAEPTQVNPSWVRLGLMASDEILLASGKVSLIPSVRFDRTGRFNGFSPKLGATASLPAGLELRANAGTAYRAPSFIELYVVQGSLLPNKDLRPERAWYGDVSINHRTNVSLVSLGGFYSLYEDLISYEYYPPLLARAYNFSSARVGGLEAEGQIQAHPLVSALFGYTLLFSQNLRDDPRYYLKELPYRPRHRLHARIAAGPRWGRGRVELSYQSAQFFNRTETLSLQPRALVNVGISSTVFSAPELVASLEVKNVLDVSAQDFDGYPLPGRAAYVTLSFSWDRSTGKTELR